MLTGICVSCAVKYLPARKKGMNQWCHLVVTVFAGPAFSPTKRPGKKMNTESLNHNTCGLERPIATSIAQGLPSRRFTVATW